MIEPIHENPGLDRRSTARGRSMLSRLAMGWAIALVLAAAPMATASTIWNELGDAGSLPSNAQLTIGSGPLTAIIGTLSSTTDRDMYEIFITGGGTFSATTVGQPGTVFDTQLFLFNLNGLGIYANDDDPLGVGSSQFRSTLPANHPLTPITPGLYLLLIDNSPAFPTSAGGVIFPNFVTGTSSTAVVGPTGPGGGSPITGYSASGTETGTYTIALTGAQFAAVPAPGSFVLMSIATPCVLTLACLRRKRAGCRGTAASA